MLIISLYVNNLLIIPNDPAGVGDCRSPELRPPDLGHDRKVCGIDVHGRPAPAKQSQGRSALDSQAAGGPRGVPSSAHRAHTWRSTTQNARSAGPMRGLMPLALNAASCCRNARFSRTS